MITIKAISLWQPWAALVAAGEKRYETRSYPTRHRGPLLICSAKRWNSDLAAVERDFIKDGAKLEPWTRKLGVALCIVDVANVYEVIPNDRMDDVDSQVTTYALPQFPERGYGDYTRGRYAWRLTNLRPLGEGSFAVTGRQGIFNIEIDETLLD